MLYQSVEKVEHEINSVYLDDFKMSTNPESMEDHEERRC